VWKWNFCRGLSADWLRQKNKSDYYKKKAGAKCKTAMSSPTSGPNSHMRNGGPGRRRRRRLKRLWARVNRGMRRVDRGELNDVLTKGEADRRWPATDGQRRWADFKVAAPLRGTSGDEKGRQSYDTTCRTLRRGRLAPIGALNGESCGGRRRAWRPARHPGAAALWRGRRRRAGRG
jgi:hypothetical protein